MTIKTMGRTGMLLLALLAVTVHAQTPDSVLDSLQASIRRLGVNDSVRVTRWIDVAEAAAQRGRGDLVGLAVDSALRTAERQKRPIGMAKALVAFGIFRTMRGDFEGGIADMKRGIAMYEALGERYHLARSLYLLAARLSRGGKTAEALTTARRAETLHTALADSGRLVDDWNIIGMIYFDQGNKTEAATYFSRCLAVYQRSGDRGGEAMALVNLANTMPSAEEERAVEYYGRAADFYRASGETATLGHVLHLLGISLSHLQQLDEARAVLEEASTLLEHTADVPLRLMVMNTLSNVYYSQGQNELALRTRESHLQLARETKNDIQIAQSLINLGRMKLDEHEVEPAYAKAQEALGILQRAGNGTILASAYELLVNCESARGDFAAAYWALTKYVALKRESEGIEARKHIDSLAARYDAANREQRISLLEQERRINALTLKEKEYQLSRQQLIAEQRRRDYVILEQTASIRDLELARKSDQLAVQKAESEKRSKDLALARVDGRLKASQLARQTQVRNTLLVGLLLLLVTAALVFRHLRGKRREAALRAEAAESETLRVAAQGARREKEAQQTFTTRLIQSQEQDRQRIARELHDGLSQSLLIIRNRALMGLRAQSEPEKILAQMQVISDTAASSIEDVRAISRDLRPSQLDRLGLTETLRSAVESAGNASDTRFTVDIAEIGGVFAREDEINVYRIVQEGVNNILKHSRAREALVLVTRDAAEVRITIEDDGRGFDAQSGNGSGARGFGLQGMAERARMLHGVVTVTSTPGEGTRVRVSLPLPDRNTAGGAEHA